MAQRFGFAKILRGKWETQQHTVDPGAFEGIHSYSIAMCREKKGPLFTAWSKGALLVEEPAWRGREKVGRWW